MTTEPGSTSHASVADRRTGPAAPASGDDGPAPLPRVLIVGGGAAGVLVAIHLLRQVRDPVLVEIAEPRAHLGEGVAYSTRNSAHLLNVPAGRMSALPDDPDHFRAWAGAGASSFLPRRRYAQYLVDLLAEAREAAAPGVTLRHRCDRVLGLRPRAAGGFTALLPHRFLRDYDAVVLATGYSGPGAFPMGKASGASASGALAGATTDGATTVGGLADDATDGATGAATDGGSTDGAAIVDDVWRDLIPAGTSDLIAVGTGLTFVDVAASHLRGSPSATITGISRHGWLPHVHHGHHGEHPAFTLQPTTTALDMVGYLRSLGEEWQAGVDALRPHIPTIWRQSPLVVRDRFLAEEGTWWNVHRHRMAPEVAQSIRAWQDEGRLRIVTGSIDAVTQAGERLQVTLNTGQTVSGDALVNCTGREPRPVRGLLRELIDTAVAQPGPLGWGLSVEIPSMRVRRTAEDVHDTLFAIGPVAIGELFETTAIPEIRVQAARLAEQLRDALATRPGAERGTGQAAIGSGRLAAGPAPSMASLPFSATSQ